MENSPQNKQVPELLSETKADTVSDIRTLKLLIVTLVVLLPIVGISSYSFGQKSPVPSLVSDNSNKLIDTPLPSSEPTHTDPVACPMDAKLCPDGSSVGRTGSACEFEDCPVVLEEGMLRLTVPSNFQLQPGESRSADIPARVIKRGKAVDMKINGVVYQVENRVGGFGMCPWEDYGSNECEKLEEPFPNADYLFIWKDSGRGVFAFNTGGLKAGDVSTDVLMISKKNQLGFTDSEFHMWKQILQTLESVESN